MTDAKEGYFYKENQELIDSRRAKLDAQRERREENNSDESYWLTCPKCGGDMKEENLYEILIDKCQNCEGIFFDKGELETVLISNERKGFLKYMKERLYD